MEELRHGQPGLRNDAAQRTALESGRHGASPEPLLRHGAEFWINVQTHYDLKIARRNLKPEDAKRIKALGDHLPSSARLPICWRATEVTAMTYAYSRADFHGNSSFEFARPRSRAERIARIDALATLLDTAFILPGINVRFGLDALIGLVPGIGDAITTAMSLYIVHEARQLGAPGHLIARMLGNVLLDGMVGAVPLVGDAFDVLWRANRRNMRLLQEWLQRAEGRQKQPVRFAP